MAQIVRDFLKERGGQTVCEVEAGRRLCSPYHSTSLASPDTLVLSTPFPDEITYKSTRNRSTPINHCQSPKICGEARDVTGRPKLINFRKVAQFSSSLLLCTTRETIDRKAERGVFRACVCAYIRTEGE